MTTMSTKKRIIKTDGSSNRLASPKDLPSVTVTIRRAGKMTPERRKEINNWLRRVGTALVREAEKYADRFEAKFFIPRKK